MRPDYFAISWDHLKFSLFTRGINRGHYVAAQRHEISLWVLIRISLVSPPFELFYDELKVTRCCRKTFCLFWVLRSKTAFMRCVTFSNVLYVFGLFINNQFGHVNISAWVSRFASVRGCLQEKSRAGASFIPTWLFDFLSRLHDEWVISHLVIWRYTSCW